VVVALENSNTKSDTKRNRRKLSMKKLLLIGGAILLAACSEQVAISANSGVQIAEVPKFADPTHAGLEIFPEEASIALATPMQIELPRAETNPVSAWRPPPYAAPLALRESDHFYFSRPIPSGEVNWANPNYRYGSTANGEESIHTGVDLGAQRATPVLAAARGEVVWVGYGLYRGVFDTSDPYGLAIAIKHDFGHLNQTLYTVYAHLQGTTVWKGQVVDRGEVIGEVGSTGHATGPHLHFEVRLGENRYFATRNPELWVVPAEGWGVLAGKMLDSFGRPQSNFYFQVESIETGDIWEAWSYEVGTIIPDEIYQENFVIGDLPGGPYIVRTFFIGKVFETSLFLYPGQTNTVLFRGRHGFLAESNPTPVEFPQP
jgi:murein DD-endopeptidase MepM/ murein hydrolase activator NlpD